MYKIEFIKPQEIDVIIPFLQMLHPVLTVEELKPRLIKMLNNNYSCIGVYDGENLIGIAGFWIIQKYYTGAYIEPDNVVVLPTYRGKKIGEFISKWIDEYAINNDYVASNLNAYVTNDKAIKFWLNQGYKIISFHFQKKYV